MRFTVGVKHGFGRKSLHDKTSRLLSPHCGLGERAGKETNEQRERADDPDGRYHGEIEQTIVDARIRRDARVVPVLVGVGDGESEKGSFLAAMVVRDRAGKRNELPPRASARREVTAKSALREQIKTRRDFRLETEPGDGEKRMTIREARIDFSRSPADKNIECARHRSVNTEMAAETVTRSARDQPKDHLGVDEHRGDFVHGAIASGGDDDLRSVGSRALREFRSMTRTFRERDGRAMLERKRADRFKCGGGAAGARVHDEMRLHECAMNSGATAFGNRDTPRSRADDRAF